MSLFRELRAMGLKDLIGKFTGKTETRAHTNRAVRVRINYLHHIEFSAREPRYPALKIENISASGIGLVLPVGTPPIERIKGDLKFADTSHALELKTVWRGGDRVGAIIENPSPAFTQALQKYFEHEISALKLKPVNKDYLKKSDKGQPHWYAGDNNCDVAFVTDPQGVVEFAITVFGNHIEGGRNRALTFSQISELEPGDAAGYKAADLLQTMNKRDATLVSFAQRVINAVENLPSDQKVAILKYLN